MIFKANSLKGLLINLGIMIVIVVLMVLFFFYVYLPTTTNHGETITVPKLNGIHIDEIDEFLTKRDLRYEVTTDSGFNPDSPPLTILKQFPKPGSKVKEKRKIYITLNAEFPPLIKMPDLVNRSMKNALVTIESYGLKIGSMTYKPSSFHNLILGMEMEGEKITKEDSVFKGSTIDLIIGTRGGSRKQETPDILGDLFNDAEFIAIANQLNLLPVAVDDVEFDVTLLETTDTIPPGFIIKQIPAPFETIYSGNSIDVWLSTDSSLLVKDSLIVNEN